MRDVDLMETSDQISRAEELTNEVVAEVKLASVGLTAGPSAGPSMGLSTGPNVGRRGRIMVSKLRLGSWNIETLTGELVKIFEKRRVDIAYIQENEWSGNRAWEIDGWKAWHSGESKSRNGVGVLVGKNLRDQVVRVEHRNDRLMVVKLIIEGAVLNVISAWAPQAGLGEEVKRRFWEELSNLVRRIPKRQHFVVGGNFNGQIGRSGDGYSDSHGGLGFGDRDESGLALLEFSVAFGCVITNSLFRKKDEHLITFQNETCRSQIDYFVVGKEDRRRCRNCKVIPFNGITNPHRLLLLDFDFPHNKRKKNSKTQPIKRPVWWNQEVREKLKAKKTAYRSFVTCTSEEEKEGRLAEYKMAKKEAKKVVAKAKEGETIISMQPKCGARVQVVPLPPPGDTSTQRSVYINGTKEQIDPARELINDVMNRNCPNTYSAPTGSTQAYPQSRTWVPQGQPPVHQQQQAGYAMPPLYYEGYPPQQASWDQSNPSKVPLQPQQTTYGQQPVPPRSTFPSAAYNYSQAPSSSYNYNQGYAQQPPYGHVITSTEQQKPYLNPNSAYVQPPPASSQPETSVHPYASAPTNSYGTCPRYGPPASSQPESSAHPYDSAPTNRYETYPRYRPPASSQPGISAHPYATAPTNGYGTYPRYGIPLASHGYRQMDYGQQQGAQPSPTKASYTYPPASTQPHTSAPTNGYGAYPRYGAPPASHRYRQIDYGQPQGAQMGPTQSPQAYPPAQGNYYQGGYPPAPGRPPV